MIVKVVVMAGGRGERFWPKSRQKRPKQFLPITGSEPMLVETVRRLEGFAARENILVGTQKNFVGLVQRLLPWLREDNLIAEPEPKDTAAAIALAALQLERSTPPETVLFFLPSDHFVGGVPEFQRNAALAAEVAYTRRSLTLLGVAPTRPSDAFGYLKLKGEVRGEGSDGVFAVEQFVEKPNTEQAKSYLSTKKYLWNAGMFFVRLDKLVSMLEAHAPEHVERLREYCSLRSNERKRSEALFARLPKISFDYAVAEKEEDIFAVKSTFLWDDVGSWNALNRLRETDAKKNLLSSNTNAFECYNVLCDVDDPAVRVVLNDLSDVNIVLNDGVLYITSKKGENNIKNILKHIGDLK